MFVVHIVFAIQRQHVISPLISGHLAIKCGLPVASLRLCYITTALRDFFKAIGSAMTTDSTVEQP
jgi:hypothetical protein